MKEWYTNSEGIVSISGVASGSYQIRQGVRQGGLLSMNLYQLYISDLLYKLQKSGCGTCHDNMYYGCPYMDDLLLKSTYPATLKKMLDLTFEYTNKWRYSFNVKKSVILPSVRRNTVLQVESVNSDIPIVSEFVHVGIPISSSGMITTPSVESRLSKGRRSFFAMCGFGGDLKVPLVSIYVKLYWSICVSSMCYGCEVISFQDREVNLLESFHRYVARRIQHLPDRCANVMCLAGLGWWSLSAYMDIRKLMFLHKLLSAQTPMCYRGIVIRKLWELNCSNAEKLYPSPVCVACSLHVRNMVYWIMCLNGLSREKYVVRTSGNH